MTPMMNDSDGVFPDDTNVTISEPADVDTLKLEDDNSTNISVNKIKNLLATYVLLCCN